MLRLTPGWTFGLLRQCLRVSEAYCCLDASDDCDFETVCFTEYPVRVKELAQDGSRGDRGVPALHVELVRLPHLRNGPRVTQV